MRKEVIALLTAIILNTVVLCTAKGATCDRDSIKTVTQDGEIIVMLSGHVYQVLPGDSIVSMPWLPASDVTICVRLMSAWARDMIYYDIITADHEEKVGAVLIR